MPDNASEQLISGLPGLYSKGLDVVMSVQQAISILVKREDIDTDFVNWVKNGGDFAKINVPLDFITQFNSQAAIQGLSLYRINDKDHDLEHNMSGDPVVHYDDNGCVIGIDNAHQYATFVVRDCDKDRANGVIDSLLKEYHMKKELDPDEANKLFKNTETVCFKNLTKFQAKIIQEELTENQIASARLYNPSEGTYSLELSAFDTKHVLDGEMTMVEKSIHDSLLKLCHPDIVQFHEHKVDLRNEIDNAILEEAVLDHGPTYQHMIIYDSFDSTHKISLADNMAIETYGDSVLTYNLRDKKGRDIISTTKYMEIMEMGKNELFSEEYEKQTKINLKVSEINIAAEKIREEQLIDTQMYIGDESPNGHSLKEVRIENSDKVISVLTEIAPVSQNKDEPLISNEEYQLKALQNIKSAIENELVHMEISDAGIHKEIATVIEERDIKLAEHAYDNENIIIRDIETEEEIAPELEAGDYDLYDETLNEDLNEELEPDDFGFAE